MRFVNMQIIHSSADEFGFLVGKCTYRTYYDMYEFAGGLYRVNPYDHISYYKEDLHAIDLTPL